MQRISVVQLLLYVGCLERLGVRQQSMAGVGLNSSTEGPSRLILIRSSVVETPRQLLVEFLMRFCVQKPRSH